MLYYVYRLSHWKNLPNCNRGNRSCFLREKFIEQINSQLRATADIKLKIFNYYLAFFISNVSTFYVNNDDIRGNTLCLYK